MALSQSDASLALVRDNFERAAASLDLYQPGTISLPPVAVSDLRRGRRFGSHAPIGSISLLERDGMLVWQLGTLNTPRQRELRRSVPRRGFLGTLLGRKEFVALGPDEIGQYLTRLDDNLTPGQGL
jgi:hypothetical protein